MKLPPPVRDRSGGLIDWLDQLYWAWRVSRPIRSETCETHESPDGTQILPRAKKGVQDGGSVVPPSPFQLVPADVRNSGGTITAHKVRVLTSTVFGDVPTGFSPGDDPPYLLTVANENIIYAILTYAVETGEITSRTLGKGSSLPADSDGQIHIRIGSVTFESDEPTTCANDRYGPIDGTICRNWFDPVVKYGASITS